ncbi:MAG: SDR family NAD(P)-dependent oxidoreductase [Fimbriimonadaceae bacterium]
MATYRTVVTGASSGIGRATALLLAKDGHALVLNARREDVLRSLAEECLAAGSSAVTVVAGDVSHPATGPQLADAVGMSGAGEVVLVNNAGTAAFGPFHEQPVETAVRMVDVLLSGAMRATHALLPTMLEEGRGTIVNVVSVAALQTFSSAEAYCAAKAGLLAFSRSLARDYRPMGVRVTSLIPGASDTALWDSIEGHPDRADMLSPQAVAEAIKMVVDTPRDRSYDEIVLTPPKGVL